MSSTQKLNLEQYTLASFQEFKNNVLAHGFTSGEIIIDLWRHNWNEYQIPDLCNELVKSGRLKSDRVDCEFIEITKKEAIESIKYGLKTKPNYTRIQQEFSLKQRNYYAHQFLGFFQNSRCFTTNSRLYNERLDLYDFWEVGGAIVGGKDKIGIFWINDIYD